MSKSKPKSAPKRKTEVEDLGGRIKAVIESSIAGLEQQVATLQKGKPTPDKTQQLVAIAKDAATVMGHVRRYDEAMRNASRDLSPAIVIAYLRALPADKRLGILAEVEDLDDGEERGGSVLS
jgi:Tfp pilus assembly protein FimV